MESLEAEDNWDDIEPPDFSSADVALALQPCEAKPGTPQKVHILTVRYWSGLPLWMSGDCKKGSDQTDDMSPLEEASCARDRSGSRILRVPKNR